MIIERCDVSEIRKVRKTNKLMEMVQDFHESDMVAARVKYEKNEYKTPNYCATALNNAIRRCELRNSVKCVTRGGVVYLIKGAAIEEIQ